MADEIKKVRQTTTQDGATTRTTKEVSSSVNREEHVQDLLERLIWYAFGVLLTLLTFRFALALLGANPANAFADFIYSVTYPFVAPFFSLFGYNLQYGVSKVETYTLVAIAVYCVVAWGLARLVTLNRRSA